MDMTSSLPVAQATALLAFDPAAQRRGLRTRAHPVWQGGAAAGLAAG